MGFWDWLKRLLDWLSGPFRPRFRKTKLRLSPVVRSGPTGSEIVVLGQLMEAEKLTAIANAEVAVKVTDPKGAIDQYFAMTDNVGMFSIKVGLFVEGNYTVHVEYMGDGDRYLACEASTMLVCKPVLVPTTLVLTPSATEARVGDTVTITATLSS